MYEAQDCPFLSWLGQEQELFLLLSEDNLFQV